VPPTIELLVIWGVADFTVPSTLMP